MVRNHTDQFAMIVDNGAAAVAAIDWGVGFEDLAIEDPEIRLLPAIGIAADIAAREPSEQIVVGPRSALGKDHRAGQRAGATGLTWYGKRSTQIRARSRAVSRLIASPGRRPYLNEFDLAGSK